jgi:hypothetical protein
MASARTTSANVHSYDSAAFSNEPNSECLRNLLNHPFLVSASGIPVFGAFDPLSGSSDSVELN